MTSCLEELEKVETAFIKILGLRPRWFRPPYGSYNDAALAVLSARGYTHVALWSDDRGDSLGKDAERQKEVLRAAAAQWPAPRMVVQHSTLEHTAEVVRYGVHQFDDKGYALVAADDCVNADSPYEYVGEPEEPNET